MKDHWRGIAQTATIAVGACTAATADICAGAGGVLISAAIGAAANVGVHEVGSGGHTAAGAAQQAAIGAGSYGGAAIVGKAAMLVPPTAKYLTATDMVYNAATNWGKFWKPGSNVREVLNHCGLGTKWP
ncbi:hypothetical protein ACFVZ3_12555 [Kitasatospora purpeofusca]|uniref:hypothetical protein n=1 Tax=Kitasatospora purpeofusca TaxID=67352 RepID=UPI0036CDBC84